VPEKGPMHGAWQGGPESETSHPYPSVVLLSSTPLQACMDLV
jgi:hypothetical protein